MTVNQVLSYPVPRKKRESVYECIMILRTDFQLAGHRVLALNRGEKEKILTVKINAPEEEILSWLNVR